MESEQGAARMVARLARALLACGLLGAEAELEDMLAAPADAFVSPAALFDAAYYRAQVPAALAREVNPLRHYLEIGAAAMLAPHPCFDLELESAAAEAVPPLILMLEARAAPYATPNLLFEPERYTAGLPAGALGLLPPFEHFLRYWPSNQAKFSRYFDVAFYARRNPHLARAGINPLVHYCSQSPEQRHDANPMFHGKYYSSAYPHVRGDPLLHFLRSGLREGCLPNPYAAQELRLARREGSRAAFAQALEAYVAVFGQGIS